MRGILASVLPAAVMGVRPGICSAGVVFSGSDDVLGADELLGADEFGADEFGADEFGAVRRPARANPRAQAMAVARQAAKMAQTGAGMVANRRQIAPASSAAAIPLSTSATITVSPQRAIRPERLIVDADTADNFTIEGINVGADPQFVNAGSVPAAVFQPDATEIGLKGTVATVGMQISIAVTNTDAGAAHFFRGAIIGWSVD